MTSPSMAFPGRHRYDCDECLCLFFVLDIAAISRAFAILLRELTNVLALLFPGLTAFEDSKCFLLI
jgi:hypothetical protein